MANEENLRSESFPSGIASVGLGKVERQVSADEPPPLPPNGELAVIGKPVPRQDGRAKVTGAVRFTVDVSLPGMLHARILRSPMPHALVRSIDISAAARHPGVRAILPIVSPVDPKSATLRYIGAPVAAVAAVSMAAAEEALRLIHVDYQSLPFVAEMDQAREPAAPAGLRQRNSARRSSLGFSRSRESAAQRQRAWTGNQQTRRRHARLRPGRCRCRGRISHPGADPLLP